MTRLALALATLAGAFGTAGAAAQAPLSAPPGFHLQVLEATDGRAIVPDGWTYTNHGTADGWIWTFAKENNPDGHYDTGMRIQLVVGAATARHQSVADLARGVLEQKRRAGEVVVDCPATDAGDFMRQCLQTLEGTAPRYHVLYSLFWSKKGDMLVVTTFGTPEPWWTRDAPIADRMAAFQIIGPDLGKTAAP